MGNYHHQWWQFPIKVTQMIHEQGIDANEAFYLCGLTPNRKIGSSEGAIGMLTKGRINRKDYTTIHTAITGVSSGFQLIRRLTRQDPISGSANLLLVFAT